MPVALPPAKPLGASEAPITRRASTGLRLSILHRMLEAIDDERFHWEAA
jgi:hypothetical protein